MPEEEDVKAAPSPAPEEETQVKEDVTEAPSASPSEVSAPTASVTQDDVDEKGVPWKNREAEIRRKTMEELQPWIQQQIQEGMSKQSTVKPAESQQAPANSWQGYFSAYTDEQIEAWADENPQYRPFVRGEINRRIEDRAEKRAFEKLNQTTRQQNVEQEKQGALKYIAETYEDAFTELPNGQKMWNVTSPIYQRAVQLYNSRPTFKEDGWGLAGAFDMAFGQIAREERMKLAKDKIKVTAKQRKEEKLEAQAISAGGKSAPASQSPDKVKVEKLREAWIKRGDQKARLELFKMRGLVPDM